MAIQNLNKSLCLPAGLSGAAAGKCAHCYVKRVCCLSLVIADYIGPRPRALPRRHGELLKLLRYLASYVLFSTLLYNILYGCLKNMLYKMYIAAMLYTSRAEVHRSFIRKPQGRHRLGSNRRTTASSSMLLPTWTRHPLHRTWNLQYIKLQLCNLFKYVK